MNTITRMPIQSQKALTPVSEKGNQPVRSNRQSQKLVVACAVLVFASLGFIPLAAAHSEIDPEIQEITEKLTKNPNSVDLLISRGQVYRSDGKFMESLQDLERAWLLDRENRTVILQRALTLSAMGRDKEAETALDYFLQEESDPKRIFALAERAHIRAQTGRIELAIKDFTSVLRIQPSGELYLNRGKLQESLGRLEEAATGYEEGIAKLGQFHVTQKRAYRNQIAQGKYDEALVLIDEQLNTDSFKYSVVSSTSPEVLGQMGKSDAAGKTYEQALSEAESDAGETPHGYSSIGPSQNFECHGETGRCRP